MNDISADQISALPMLPRDAEGPVFAEPWQAQAFAMTLTLHQAGCFTWQEWADALSGAIAAAHKAGDPDLGDTYYLHWLGALETVLHEKRIVSRAEQVQRSAQWRHAADETAHGEPIQLRPEAEG